MAESPLNKVADVASAARDAVTGAGHAVVGQIQDPVCGKLVTPGEGSLHYHYAEETYYFDTQQCLDRFAEQPEVFLSHPGEEGDTAFDRAQRPDAFQHRGELKPGTPHTFEQPRVESGSG